MTRKQKKTLWRILISALLLLAAALLPDQIYPGEYWVVDFTGQWTPPADWLAAGYTWYDFGIVKPLTYLIPYLVIGWDVLWKALRNIKNGQVFDENFLMSLATVGAFACGEYGEAVAVMLFYQVGELFQSVAVHRSRRSIAQLMDIRPDFANVEREEGLVQVDPEEVQVGELILVKPGERVPLDGTVEEGTSALDTAALTGESLPRDVGVGDEVVSGCVNLSGALRVRVKKPYGQSTVARILDLVENSSAKKARSEQFITRFARVYTPAVVVAAVVLAVLPPVLGFGTWNMWFTRALNFLVVSCPCALVISIPLSFFGGIGGASRRGILVKGGNYLETLARTQTVVFDKTGTLTQGKFSVTQILPQGMEEGELLEKAALAEGYSTHPISQAIRRQAGELDLSRLGEVEELAGMGVRAQVDGSAVLAGNRKLMAHFSIPLPQGEDPVGTVVHVAVDGVYAGCLVIADQVKPGAAEALEQLKKAGVSRTVMLTGDAPQVGEAVGRALGLDQVHAGLLPGDKVEWVERLLAEKAPGTALAFVGDGINDAPVLSRADVGVAMGAMGSDAAIEAADVVLMDDDLSKLPQAVAIARKTLRVVKENTIFAIGIKLAVLVLSAFGLVGLWWAVFADVGVSVLAILNASRMLRS